MNILGISCFYHDSAACLLKDGEIIAAAQEERFNRRKYSDDFPIQAINFCLQAGNLTIYDIDYIGFYEKPFLKFERVIINHLKSYPFSLKNFLDIMPRWLEDRLIIPLKIENELGYKGKVLFIKHHLSHAASAFLVSPFKEAAILTADGIGEWASASYGIGSGNNIKILKELYYPNSLGLLYSAITAYLGFKVFTGEGKVMALAALGKPCYLEKFKKIFELKEDGSFRVDPKFFGFNKGSRMYQKKFVEIFGKERKPKSKFEQRHYDMASSLQKFLEEIVIKMARNLYNETKLNNLCLAGGTFLNVVANSRILKETPFKEIFIQPAAGDASGALGVASYIYYSLLNNKRGYVMKNAYLGPKFSKRQIKRLLLNRGANFKEFKDTELTKYIAKKIAQNKIVGWFQGKMEFGPRALGHRSILANSQNPKMKDMINEKVKHREWFRPYAVSILLEELNNYFDLNVSSPFMLLTAKVKESKKNLIPSGLHIDKTSRIQTITKKDNGIYYDLVKEFKKITGIPMIINTSFNGPGEPIICKPEEAYNLFSKSKMDCLVLENYVVEKE